MKLLIPAIMILPVLILLQQPRKIKIFLAGDSTISIKQTTAYPETGWGMPFVYFWDSTVQVVNLAKNGRSSRTFIEEGLWKKIMDGASEGDYVFIQFGHNDEVQTKITYTPEAEYRKNLLRFVTETRDRGAQPVLVTPVARRKFDNNGKVVESHQAYSKIVREVADLEEVPLIDLDKKSQDLYQQLGEEYSKMLFLQLRPGEHPNYPNGKTDNTHFNELGAREIAQLVLAGIREAELPLTDRIVKGKP